MNTKAVKWIIRYITGYIQLLYKVIIYETI